MSSFWGPTLVPGNAPFHPDIDTVASGTLLRYRGAVPRWFKLTVTFAFSLTTFATTGVYLQMFLRRGGSDSTTPISHELFQHLSMGWNWVDREWTAWTHVYLTQWTTVEVSLQASRAVQLRPERYEISLEATL